jgi:hypothetical protein
MACPNSNEPSAVLDKEVKCCRNAYNYFRVIVGTSYQLLDRDEPSERRVANSPVRAARLKIILLGR